jgi:hypothetical protein
VTTERFDSFRKAGAVMRCGTQRVKVVQLHNPVPPPYLEFDMSKVERAFVVLVLVCIAVAAIDWIGRNYFALLAMFEWVVGL